MKLDIQTALNMQNVIIMFIYPAFDRKYIFLGKFDLKNQNRVFKMKFDIWSNLKMLNLMEMFKLSLLDWKYSFWANLIQNLTILS